MVPTEPEFGTFLADSRAQQVQAALAQALRFFHPSHGEALKRLDTVSGMVLHTLKDDEGAVLADDLCLLNVEQVPNAKRFNLFLEQLFNRLVKGLLHFAHAHRMGALHDASLDQQFREEVRLTRATATMSAFVARRLQERRECAWRW